MSPKVGRATEGAQSHGGVRGAELSASMLDGAAGGMGLGYRGQDVKSLGLGMYTGSLGIQGFSAIFF